MERYTAGQMGYFRRRTHRSGREFRNSFKERGRRRAGYHRLHTRTPDRERELVFVHKTVYDGEIHPSDELDGGRFWSYEEIKTNLGKGVFTPNFESEIDKVEIFSSTSPKEAV